MSLDVDILGTDYPVPASAADTNWAAIQLAAFQALAAGLNDTAEAVDDLQDVTWVPLSLINSWHNVGGGFAPAAYYVDELGQTHLRFAVDTGTNDTVAFVLPLAARPPYPCVFLGSGPAPDDLISISIATNGNVTLRGVGAADAGDGTIFEHIFSTVANP